MRLSEHIYRTVSTIAGPLLFVQNVQAARIGEIVTVHAPDGRHLEAEVLEITGDTVLVEVYGGTQGLDIDRTSVSFTDAIKKVPLSSGHCGQDLQRVLRTQGRLAHVHPGEMDTHHRRLP